jgi:hypothetical protein
MVNYTSQPGRVHLPPYGEKDQHLVGPENHGYHHLVAYMVDQGYAASHIAKTCQKAAKSGAPLNAVKLFQGQWLTIDNAEGNPDQIRWAEYANVLAMHEQHTQPCDVWATTDDPIWLDRNHTADVLVVHNVPRHEAEEIASRLRLLAAAGSVVRVTAT